MQTKYIRKGATIIDITNEVHKQKSFNSINAAKRESRKLQMAEESALGRGSLMIG